MKWKTESRQRPLPNVKRQVEVIEKFEAQGSHRQQSVLIRSYEDEPESKEGRSHYAWV